MGKSEQRENEHEPVNRECREKDAKGNAPDLAIEFFECGIHVFGTSGVGGLYCPLELPQI